jgi:hypothetical protein
MSTIRSVKSASGGGVMSCGGPCSVLSLRVRRWLRSALHLHPRPVRSAATRRQTRAADTGKSATGPGRRSARQGLGIVAAEASVVCNLVQSPQPATEAAAPGVRQRVAQRHHAHEVAVTGMSKASRMSSCSLGRRPKKQPPSPSSPPSTGSSGPPYRVDVPVRGRPARLVHIGPALVRLGVASQIGPLVGQAQDQRGRSACPPATSRARRRDRWRPPSRCVGSQSRSVRRSPSPG